MNSVIVGLGPFGKRARPISALEAEKLVKEGKARFVKNKLYEEIRKAEIAVPDEEDPAAYTTKVMVAEDPGTETRPKKEKRK